MHNHLSVHLTYGAVLHHLVFDCSGLTQYVYAHFGKQIGRNTIAQESAGAHIPVSQAQVGDLLFWGTPGSTYHVAIYLGGNSFVAAPTRSKR